MNFKKEEINSFYQKNKRFTGENYNSLYMRYQNDYYLSMNIFNIKNRRSQYKFAPGFKMMDNGLLKKLKGDANDYKTYVFKKNNQYLGSKILQISTRNKGKLKMKTNTDFLSTIKTKGNSYAKLREMEKERIATENEFYHNRIRNSNSYFKKTNYSQFAKDQQKFSKNLRKILPINALKTSEGFNKRQNTPGNQRYKTEGCRDAKTSQCNQRNNKLPPIEKKTNECQDKEKQDNNCQNEKNPSKESVKEKDENKGKKDE